MQVGLVRGAVEKKHLLIGVALEGEEGSCCDEEWKPAILLVL